MSRKEKTITLFSRNGIKITKVDYLDMTKWSNQDGLNMFVKNDIDSSLKRKEDKTEIIAAKKAWDETITRESKLGFYYYQIVHHDAENAKIQCNDIYSSARFRTYVFKFDNKRFEMLYPVRCGDISINKETRPWDILPGYKGIEDHFITDLYKEVIKFFEVAEVNRVAYKEEYVLNMSWIYDVRKEVMIDLFGDEKGPTVNYNNIKILSHGFDLKQSFRKRKENDNK